MYHHRLGARRLSVKFSSEESWAWNITWHKVHDFHLTVLVFIQRAHQARFGLLFPLIIWNISLNTSIRFLRNNKREIYKTNPKNQHPSSFSLSSAINPTLQYHTDSLLRRNSAPRCLRTHFTQRELGHRICTQQSFHLFQHFSKELISHQSPKAGISASACTAWRLKSTPVYSNLMSCTMVKVCSKRLTLYCMKVHYSLQSDGER